MDVTGHQLDALIRRTRDSATCATLLAIRDHYRTTVWGRFCFAPDRQAPLFEAYHRRSLEPFSYPGLDAEIDRTNTITITLEAPYDTLAQEVIRP